MAKTHLQTAHEYGVKKALEKCGYASIEEVQKDIEELGLNQTPAPQKTAADAGLDNVFASLKAKLG
jgi:hypothetical protein